MSDIDTSKAEADLIKEKAQKAEQKLSELELKLKEYQEKEAEQKAAEQKAEQEKLLQEKLDAEKKAMEEMVEAKLDKISLRQSTANTANTDSKLTKEEYLKNREHYDTMKLKHDLPSVFN